MKKDELKTRKNDANVKDFLDSIDNETRRRDSFRILEIMSEITGEEPAMWGSSIVGFGAYRYRYASGQEGDWPLTGFSPRKQSLTLYIMGGFSEYESLLADLGRHKTGKACLYITKLDDVDMDVLRKLIKLSVAQMKEESS